MLLALGLLLSSTSALACTGLYVGKQVSEDGATILARTVDTHPCLTPTLEVVVPRVENTPGRKLTGGYTGFSYDLPDTTYKYTSTPFAACAGGDYASAATNEMGVAVTATVTAYVQDAWYEADPMNWDTGLTEAVVTDLIASCAATAREGVEVVAKAIEQNGNCEQNIIMIADQNEAWYMETYTGHQWCAVKMPEDAVAVFGNEFMIQTIDPESDDVMYSEGLFTVPEEAGLTVLDEEGNVDLFSTYCGKGNLNAGANRRTWYGHVLLAPSTAGDYAMKTRYPLFYQPDEKVTLSDIFELTRSRFEGTEWNPEDTGRPDIRVIGIERQVNCGVIEIYDDLPAAMSAVTWTTVANAEHSVYLPLSNLITDVAEAFDHTPEGFTSDSYGYDLSYAHTHFKRLCALSEQDREHYGTGVRAYWKSVEDALIAEYPSVLEETAKLYAEDPAKAAEYITNYTVEKQEKALADCDTMYDELTWYMIANTNTMTYNSSRGEFNTWKNFVPSLSQTEDAAN